MQLTPEHVAIQRMIKRLIDEEINPYVEQWEADEIFPAHTLFRKMGDLGLLGLNKPVEFGGMGLDYSYSAVMAEAMADIHCGGIPMAVGVQTDMATPALAKYGTDDLRHEFLAPSIAGELVACIGISEVGSGSDVASIKTIARKDGDDYVINGGKIWITNGTQADFCVVLANTSDDKAHRNKSLIVVPMKTKGVDVAKKIRKIGMNSSDTAQIFFDDVRVPQRYRIGEEGKGFIHQMEQFQVERIFGALTAGKQIANVIDETIEYTRERKAFGRPILDNQWVQFKFAEYKTEVEALRSLSHRAVEVLVAGDNATELATMAKLKAGRLIREVTDGCLQFWGGMGYTIENKVSRAFRDGRLVSIGGGADEIMMQILSKFMGTYPHEV
ncbi:acyl-CoA dehydrogenase family protein [Castellaniella sp. GW247-6E4]|uniref:acyl-CoA dehydrogenase family protein n=1 Tax=Castellaniella sp. GW247-6E4 TaxID=3140380 RepID=UPI003315CC81